LATYTTKAGRDSPYFFNAGNFSTGAATSQLCRLYATTILASGLGQTALYGPAYKGIPLAAGVAAKLFELGGLDLPFSLQPQGTQRPRRRWRSGRPAAGRRKSADY
jgi:orotate phosphoribosyltransferase